MPKYQLVNYKLTDDLYLLPTPAGAFYAVSGAEHEPGRQLLLNLFNYTTSPLADAKQLCRWFGIDDEQQALEQLYRVQLKTWVQGYSTPQTMLERGIGKELVDLLGQLSSIGKGLLVDWNGRSLAHSGMDDETAEQLGALCADLSAIQRRHGKRLERYLGLPAQGWAAVDAYGASRVGAWPLFIGDKRFMLALIGEPRLNRTEFISLVWLLNNRYGNTATDS